MVSRRVKENQTVGAKLLALESDIKKVSSQSAGSADSEVAEKVDRLERYLLGGDIEGGGGSSVYIDDTPPPSPAAGDLWFDSTDGKTYIYYNDGDSSQWVGLGGGNVGYPLGAVYAWPIETVPSWALELNGQAVSRTTYSGLFALLGTTYGVGDGSTTFNLPDYRGRTLVGQNSGTFTTLGGNVGSETHSHPLSAAGQAAITTAAGSVLYQRTVSQGFTANVQLTTNNRASSTASATQSTELQGSTDAASSIQPSTVVKWVICAATSAGDFDTEVQTALVTRVSDTPLSQNFILNGAFDVWQRGTSVVPSSTVNYSADRWESYRGSFASGLTVARVGLTPPEGFEYHMRVTRDSGNTSLETIIIAQPLETQDSVFLAGKTVTFSYYARKASDFSSSGSVLTASIITGTGTDQNLRGGFTGQATAGQADAVLTDQWQRFSVTATLSSATNQVAVSVRYTPTGTAGGADRFDLAGVQLELGDAVTPFRRANPTVQGEIAACQRYYKRIVTSGATQFIATGFAFNATSGDIFFDFATPMRTTPTFSYDQTASAFIFRHSGGSSGSITSITPRASATSPSSLSLTFASTGMVEGAGYFRSNIAGNAWVEFDAEL